MDAVTKGAVAFDSFDTAIDIAMTIDKTFDQAEKDYPGDEVEEIVNDDISIQEAAEEAFTGSDAITDDILNNVGDIELDDIPASEDPSSIDADAFIQAAKEIDDGDGVYDDYDRIIEIVDAED